VRKKISYGNVRRALRLAVEYFYHLATIHPQLYKTKKGDVRIADQQKKDRDENIKQL